MHWVNLCKRSACQRLHEQCLRSGKSSKCSRFLTKLGDNVTTIIHCLPELRSCVIIQVLDAWNSTQSEDLWRVIMTGILESCSALFLVLVRRAVRGHPWPWLYCTWLQEINRINNCETHSYEEIVNTSSCMVFEEEKCWFSRRRTFPIESLKLSSSSISKPPSQRLFSLQAPCQVYNDSSYMLYLTS